MINETKKLKVISERFKVVSDRKVSLKEAQEFVGGWVEVVRSKIERQAI